MRIVSISYVPATIWLSVATAGLGRPAEPAGMRAVKLPEWVIRIADIATGDPMKGGSSPLAVSKSGYGWEWLAARHGIPAGEALARRSFRGPGEFFDRLDRDGDGRLTAADFDWSDRSPFVQQQAAAAALFQRLNADGDGVVSAKEWQAAFDRLAGPGGRLTAEDVRRGLLAGPPPQSVQRPTRSARLAGFLSAELGSFNEGPDPGQPAPDFELCTPDGARTVRLSEFRGRKPVVLVFGSFT